MYALANFGGIFMIPEIQSCNWTICGMLNVGMFSEEGEECEIRRADVSHSGARVTTRSCWQKSQLQDESHLVTDSLLWDSWSPSFVSSGAEYLLGTGSANRSTELLETNLSSGGWQLALRNQQPTEEWWSILMLQLQCFLPWVPCSAGGWGGHGGRNNPAHRGMFM